MADIETKSIVSDCILHMLNGYNSGITQEQFYKNNIVDTSDITEAMMKEVNDEVIEYCRENGCYAALPPFEHGSFIDRSERRYVEWQVLDVEEDYFRIEFNHYPIIHTGTYYLDLTEDIARRCWYRSCRTVVKVKVLTTEEHIALLSHHPDFEYLGEKYKTPEMLEKLSNILKTTSHVGGVLESYEYFMPRDLKKIYKKGKYSTSDGQFVNATWIRSAIDETFESEADMGLNSVLFCSLGPIVEMFIYINYMLLQKSTSTSTLRHITSTYALNTDTPELRKERHFGKIKIISEKKPRAINVHNIQRIYTTMSWQRRSHVRHLASGKVVPVKSAVCKRHNADTTTAPQVIYKA